MQHTPIMLPTVRKLLKANQGRWQTIADDTGIKLKTIKNIVYGVVDDPSVNKVEVLHKYLTDSSTDSAA